MKNIRLYAITILVLIGLGVSVYLTLTHYGLLGQTSVSCSVDGSCKKVAQSPSLDIFGVPASLAGVGYFSFLAFCVAARYVFGSWIGYWYLFAYFIVGLAVSGALIYIMYTRFSPCPYCLTVHACNVFAFVLYLFESRN